MDSAPSSGNAESPGGGRDNTALGRALLVPAPVLVLDDALASVDNNTAAAILASIRRRRIAPS